MKWPITDYWLTPRGIELVEFAAQAVERGERVELVEWREEFEDETSMDAIKPVYQREGVTLYHGDCLAILPQLEAGSVDAVVTSPPYAQQRVYGGGLAPWDTLMDGLLNLPCASPDCQLLINLGLIHREGECVPYWESWRDRMRNSGWRFFGWYVWDQTFGLPGDWNGRCAPSHEFVFHFNKESRRPNKIKPCVKFGKTVSAKGMRNKNGIVGKCSHAGRPYQPFKIPDSVARICREQGRSELDGREHPARFPVSFAKHWVESYSCREQTILDPFMGSGTTGVACIRTGRKFIGIELERKYVDIAIARVEKAFAEKAERLWVPVESNEPATPSVAGLFNADVEDEQ